jgi:hypothetical protein
LAKIVWFLTKFDWKSSRRFLGKDHRFIGEVDWLIVKIDQISVNFYYSSVVPVRFDRIFLNFTDFFQNFLKIDRITHIRIFFFHRMFEHWSQDACVRPSSRPGLRSLLAPSGSAPLSPRFWRRPPVSTPSLLLMLIRLYTAMRSWAECVPSCLDSQILKNFKVLKCDEFCGHTGCD